MRTLYKVLIAGTSILILLAIIVFVIAPSIPFFIVGPPTPLFIIYNNDVNSHEVTVEIFDFYNQSLLFKEKYVLAPGGRVEYPEDLWLKKLWVEDGRKIKYKEYIFKLTLDNKITKNQTVSLHMWSTACINLYPELDITIPTV
jgi:hypothetical protein